MSFELLLRLAFYAMFLTFVLAMRAPTRSASTRQGSLSARLQAHHDHEVPRLLRLRQIFGLPFYVGLLTWTFAPQYIRWAALPFPGWLRVGGAAVGAAAVALNAWSHRTLARRLGDAFDPALRLRPVPTLVTEGPFARVRHPIYLAFLLVQIAVLLITANGLVGGCGLAIIFSVIVVRVPVEERLLIEQFGDDYRRYAAGTGRLVPRFR